MPDDNKTPAPPPRPDGDQKSQPNAPQSGQGSVENLPTKPDQKPATPAAAKPPAPAAGTPSAGAPAKPAAPPKATGPVPIPWESEMVTRLKQRYGSGIREASTYLGQNYMIVDSSLI